MKTNRNIKKQTEMDHYLFQKKCLFHVDLLIQVDSNPTLIFYFFVFLQIFFCSPSKFVLFQFSLPPSLTTEHKKLAIKTITTQLWFLIKNIYVFVCFCILLLFLFGFLCLFLSLSLSIFDSNCVTIKFEVFQ